MFRGKYEQKTLKISFSFFANFLVFLIFAVDIASWDPFLDATTHLYKRLCPSVGPSVGPSVRPPHVIFK